MQELIEQLRKDVARGARNVDKARQALALLESLELNDGDLHPQPEPPPPAPTPAAPDPGPGWRLIQKGEQYPGADWQYYSDGCWKSAMSNWGDVKADGTVHARTPIYHNPANLETAGDGYRFCLVSETEEVGATEWFGNNTTKWNAGAQCSGCTLSPDYTYRTNKLLPTT